MGNNKLLYCLRELVGKTLGCWCLKPPCHGYILLEAVDLYLIAAEMRNYYTECKNCLVCNFSCGKFRSSGMDVIKGLTEKYSGANM